MQNWCVQSFLILIIGLFPLPLFSGNAFFEEKKTLYHALGTFSIWRYICQIELILAKHFLKLYSPELEKTNSFLFDQMTKVRRNEVHSIKSLCLDCSLPGYPSVNLLPEYVLTV